MAFLHHPPRRCLGFDIAKDTIAISDGRDAIVIPNQRNKIRRFLRNCDADFATLIGTEVRGRLSPPPGWGEIRCPPRVPRLAPPRHADGWAQSCSS
jgi:hypothetical protein